MKELKILALLIIVIGALYYGVEPYAHSVMEPKTAPADFAFKDLKPIDLSKGDASKGKNLVAQNCTACHGISSQKIKAPMDAKSAAQALGWSLLIFPALLACLTPVFSPLYQRPH